MQSHFLQAVIDGSAANIAVLDRRGDIVAVNRAWCRFADSNSLGFPDHGLGANYLSVCDAAGSMESALASGEAIRNVLSGSWERFHLNFVSRDPDAERWNRMAVTAIEVEPERMAVVSNEIIDEVVGSRTILDFEDLAAELSATFVKIPASQIDNEINYWLERIVRALEIDRAVIGEVGPEGDRIYVTHQWALPGLPPIPVGLSVSRMLPWLNDRVFTGETTVLMREEDIPAEASQDLAVARSYHFKSNVTIPLKLGVRVIGGVAFGTLAQHRTWSPRVVQRLETIAQVFAHAIDRKRSRLEIHRLSDELQNLSRVALIGELTASLAHELNQPLGAILNNAQAARRLLQAKNLDPNEMRGAINEIIRDGVRATETVRNVRELFKPATDRIASVDPRRLIADAQRILREDARLRGISLRVDISEPLAKVHCHRTQLIHVIMNLMLNAFDAIGTSPDGPREVVLAVNQLDPAHVLLSVTDSGPGITPEVMPKIFDAFFTTRSQGMGMGLAIAKSIVESHGGEIRARPNSQHGATLEFTLPVAR